MKTYKGKYRYTSIDDISEEDAKKDDYVHIKIFIDQYEEVLDIKMPFKWMHINGGFYNGEEFSLEDADRIIDEAVVKIADAYYDFELI